MKKIILLISCILLIAGFWIAFLNNVAHSDKKLITLNIPTGSNYETVLNLLKEKNMLKNYTTFEWMAMLKGYPSAVKPGHYQFKRSMSNRAIINMLESGLQKPVKLVIYNIRTNEDFAGLVGRALEADSSFVIKKLNDPVFCEKLNATPATILTKFITDNYEFYWNIPFDSFIAKMQMSYANFWDNSTLIKATNLGLKPSEVITLASIVEKECIFDKELPIVASVYLNRLKINMPLQADPTLVFATRDFDTKRVTNFHKEVESPYNTYKNVGLPPGPICMPRKKSIHAVLEADSTDYLYFCANPDMSGYSIFSKTLEEQNRVAAMYRERLNKMNIH